MPIDPAERQAVTEEREDRPEEPGLLGYAYKSLDRGKPGERKRVEGVLLRSDGTPVALVEVKTLISDESLSVHHPRARSGVRTWRPQTGPRGAVRFT